MLGAYEPSAVRAAALQAVDFWQRMFDQRREQWLDLVAQQPRGFFNKRPRGRDYAEQLFQAECYPSGGQSGGVFYLEFAHLCRAKTLLEMASAEGVIAIELDPESLRTVGEFMRAPE